MKKDEIKKALLYCQNYDWNNCDDCPYTKSKKSGLCKELMHTDALKLINEQEKEIERQNSRIKALNNRLNEKYALISNMETDYNRAFERLKAQEKEIERLKAENKKVYAVRNDLVKENDELIKINAELLLLPKQAVKQAKIDVLNELKDYCAKREDYKGIEQQQKEDLLRRNEERKFRPELTSDEIQFLRSGADKANGQATMANKVVEYIDKMIEELKK